MSSKPVRGVRYSDVPERVPLPEYTGIYKLHLEAKATLGSEKLRESQQLPWGVGRCEWIAAKTVALFESLVTLVSVADTMCDAEKCPAMTCGPKIKYMWSDERNSKPECLPALEYMQRLVEWGHKLLSDPSILPQDATSVPDEKFPAVFIPCIKKLHARIFRVFAHLYTAHFEDVQAQCHGVSEAILNYHFKSWLFFVREFELVADDDIAPLRRLIERFEAMQDEREAERGGQRKPLTPEDVRDWFVV